MMSKKKWLAVFCLFVVYLLLGAALFHFLESEAEFERNVVEKRERKVIAELLKRNYIGYNTSHHEILNVLTEYCGKPINTHMGEDDNPVRWDFYHSLFFVITVVSTIGYGNLAPTTMFTRIFMIFYGLIGIPINGIVMVTLGDFFGKSFVKLYHRWKTSKMQYDTARLGLIAQIILYLVPGFTFFIFLPAVVITVFESWAFDVSVYYAFVTLTTIGFGDFVAGGSNDSNYGAIWFTIYQVFLLIWIIGGLGYVVMVLGFISQGMRSKKMKNFEHMITDNIKKTPQRIRRELRTLLHEFLFLRVKPVYKGDFEYIPNTIERSQSCPDLTIYRSQTSPPVRKRAFSECYQHMVLQRIHSETELENIDKERTFRPSDAFMQQKDLLLKLADALSYQSTSSLSSDEPLGGIDLFRDKEILASENYDSNWSISTKSNSPFSPKRRRAVSDIRPPSNFMKPEAENTGHTWYGTQAAEAFNKFRARTTSDVTSEGSSKNLFQKIRDRFKRDETTKNVDVEKTFIEPKKRRSLFVSNEEQYIRQTMRGRASLLSDRHDAMLEQTSMADFIRALTAITVPETATSRNEASKPRRKLGVGANTPPNLTPQRSRRKSAIKPNFMNNRRSSMIPTSSTNEQTGRRFSLRPVEEGMLAPPPPYRSPMSSPNPRLKLQGPKQRRFSVNIVNQQQQTTVPGPVQRQLFRKDKDDNT